VEKEITTMAKKLGPKSILIREAITANPDLGNTQIAQLLNGHEDRKKDKIEVTANDIAQQKQALKKTGVALPAVSTAAPKPPTPAPAQRGRPKGSGGQQAVTTRPAATPSSAVDLIDGVFELAEKCGGLAVLKKLVDRLAAM
jgi:hypothetical protein